MARSRGEDDVVRLAALISIGLALGAIGVAVLALRDPPDAPAHVARECRFIADQEKQRMVGHDEGGPVPFEIWRAEARTSGAARPGREWGNNQRLPWQAVLLRHMAPKTVAPIDCASALEATGAPRIIKHNEGPTRQIDRLQYSRITFFPGDRYALARVSSCWLDDNGWDQNSRIWIWRRTGVTWTPISGHLTLLVYAPPRFKPPMRCFKTPDN